jgi:hypothetical protein
MIVKFVVEIRKYESEVATRDHFTRTCQLVQDVTAMDTYLIPYTLCFFVESNMIKY